MDHRSEGGVIRHPQTGVVAVEPTHGGFQSEAGVEAGGAGIAHDVLFRLAGGVREVLEGWGKEGEVAHRSDSVSRIAWQVDLALFRGMRFPLLRRDPIRGFLIGLNYSGRACEVRCGQCYKF